MKEQFKIYGIPVVAILVVVYLLVNRPVVIEQRYDTQAVDSLTRQIILLEYLLLDAEKRYLDTMAFYGRKDSIRQYHYEKDRKRMQSRYDSIYNAPLPTDTTFKLWMRERFPDLY